MFIVMTIYPVRGSVNFPGFVLKPNRVNLSVSATPWQQGWMPHSNLCWVSLLYGLFPKELHLKKHKEGTLCYCISVSVYPKNGLLPGPSFHGILQARILEWVSILFSRGSSQPRDWIWVSWTADRFFTIWAIREVHLFHNIMQRRS